MPWDVFISHASEDKEAVTELLASALIDAGLTVWYDRFELRLGDSLRESIDQGLANSRFGIVVLSPSFFEKHWPQRELDGLVQREVKGQKVILPIWYEITADQVREHSPMLAGRVAALWSDGFESVVEKILRVVRGDPAVPPEVVEVHESRPDSAIDFDSLVLLTTMEEGKNMLIESQLIEAGEAVKFILVPANPREAAFLSGLGDGGERRVGVAYGTTGLVARTMSVIQSREASREIWQLELMPEGIGGDWEMAFAGYSADRLAEMRARRILLDEALPEVKGPDVDRLNAVMLEMFVQGQNTIIKVPHSPFPLLWTDLSNNTPLFLAAARLVAVLWLRLSGVVEYVFQLDLEMQGEDVLAVKFEGQRRRKYSNVDPPVIRVEGTCNLARDS